jgi:hypothetical protein
VDIRKEILAEAFSHESAESSRNSALGETEKATARRQLRRGYRLLVSGYQLSVW